MRYNVGDTVLLRELGGGVDYPTHWVSRDGIEPMKTRLEVVGVHEHKDDYTLQWYYVVNPSSIHHSTRKMSVVFHEIVSPRVTKVKVLL